MYDFDLHRPKTLDDAVKALAAEEAQPLAGGQTIIPTLKQRLAMPERLVSLTDIAELKGVRVEGDRMIVGGATPHATIAADAASAYPGLARLAGMIGDPAVRNRGTIGGSLANNDPAACYPAATLASDGVIVTNRREITAQEYFQGMFTTALDEGEIITEVRLRIPERAYYMKFEQPASRFALVGVFAAKFADGVRVAVTGASEGGVFRWTPAEGALAENFTPGALAGLEMAADGMISDVHGTAEYRAHLVGVMTRRAVANANA